MDTVNDLSLSSRSSGASNVSSNLTSIISFLATILGVCYLSMLLWVINLFRMRPRVFKKDYSRHLQRYAPFVYVFIVVNSLAEAACAFWLFIQYIHQQTFPSSSSRSALELIIFCSCWTMFTAGVFTILFMHPTWSTHPVASVGSQTIWVILTLCVWVAGATILACELPSQFLTGRCASVVYCSQVRALFGLCSISLRVGDISFVCEALSLLETIVLTGAMITMVWIVRQSIREALKRVSRQLVVSMMLSR
ncbi:hypothetical protein J3R30DRAFT_226034 [Lentinula aciculospora]|uniref:Uncharacterized protein n=1 Tax=Lentinula aciculospora TaxID=153920 RepID=A0A9W9AAI5_9AGAR|nr:hypothetical protein J3R30DRAFT_226034 [Lentinula aciculospora]